MEPASRGGVRLRCILVASFKARKRKRCRVQRFHTVSISVCTLKAISNDRLPSRVPSQDQNLLAGQLSKLRCLSAHPSLQNSSASANRPPFRSSGRERQANGEREIPALGARVRRNSFRKALAKIQRSCGRGAHRAKMLDAPTRARLNSISAPDQLVNAWARLLTDQEQFLSGTSEVFELKRH